VYQTVSLLSLKLSSLPFQFHSELVARRIETAPLDDSNKFQNSVVIISFGWRNRFSGQVADFGRTWVVCLQSREGLVCERSTLEAVQLSKKEGEMINSLSRKFTKEEK
jgi:hypothetical protein